MARRAGGFPTRRGGAVQNALGLGALGTVAALVGAFVVGPMLKPDRKEAPHRAPAAAIADAQATRRSHLVSEDAAPLETPRHSKHARKPATEPAPEATADEQATGGDDSAADAPAASEKKVSRGERGADSTASSDEPRADRRHAETRRSEERRAADQPGDETAEPDGSISVRETTHPRHSAAKRQEPAEEARPEAAPRRATTPAESPLKSPRAVTALKAGRTDESDTPKTSTSRKAAVPPAKSTPGSEPATSASAVYSVRTGHYASRTEADETRARLAATGIPATVIKGQDGYSVLAGSYRQKENVDRVVEILRQQKLPAEIHVR